MLVFINWEISVFIYVILLKLGSPKVISTVIELLLELFNSAIIIYTLFYDSKIYPNNSKYLYSPNKFI